MRDSVWKDVCVCAYSEKFRETRSAWISAQTASITGNLSLVIICHYIQPTTDRKYSAI